MRSLVGAQTSGSDVSGEGHQERHYGDHGRLTGEQPRHERVDASLDQLKLASGCDVLAPGPWKNTSRAPLEQSARRRLLMPPKAAAVCVTSYVEFRPLL
jgi:hypothetical protein